MIAFLKQIIRSDLCYMCGLWVYGWVILRAFKWIDV